MRRFIAVVLVVAGWSATAWSLMAGLGFSGVYLMGYIGTRGREAGSELLWMLGATVVAVSVSIAIAKLGSHLMKPPLTKTDDDAPATRDPR